MQREELFRKFKVAVEKEHEAYELYKDIAAKSKDPELRVVFERMADEERLHKETIMRRYSILKGIALD